MDINPDAELDTSQVEDIRGSGGGVGGRVAIGGGGVGLVGLLIYFLVAQLGGAGVVPQGLPQAGDLGGVRSGQQVDSDGIRGECRTGRDTAALDCEAVAVINSIQSFWSTQFARSGSKYVPANTRFFNGSVSTACGPATSDTGPFYCPGDRKIYIDLSFYRELQTRFGAQGGLFARSYVLAHEYGHHIQNLIGTSSRVRGNAAGPTSGSVRLELQADCYAGVWANHATQTKSASGKPIIENISRQDVEAGLDTAGRIGDDFIQSQIAGQQVNQSRFTHGSSAQRRKWLTAGLSTGDTKQCNTFAPGVDLG
ncbi:KPN_02809 family neutral zinc metallopeptidase [Pseudonocardia acaciae]|uniref:KPN_02809 family neutral zinc metallopeptidase n=1 Tax=Pseudonocardia acaciae TaxID=551276 RepID=UPI00048DCF4C|nr:neutral zinc metallopeptidase [Pseudonocardia acaciae]